MASTSSQFTTPAGKTSSAQNNPPEGKTSSRKNSPVVKEPSVGFLLRQVYAAYKKEIQSFSEQLANAEKAPKGPCFFCASMHKQVENLRIQLKTLLEEQAGSKENISTRHAFTQTDLPQHDSPRKKGTKRTIFNTSPRKQLCTVKVEVQQSCTENNGCKSDEEFVLVPNTPERNPQRESRVKRWLQTMEVPETVDPDLLQERMFTSPSLIPEDTDDHFVKPQAVMGANMKPANRDALPDMKDEDSGEETADEVDIDATMLPPNYHLKVTRECEITEADGEADPDETMLPLCNLNNHTMQFKTRSEEIHRSLKRGASESPDVVLLSPANGRIRNDQEENDVENSSTCSEDLLDGLKVSTKRWKQTVLTDVANRVDKHKNNKQEKVPFKFKGDPVRKKADRMQLPAHQCADCARYYEDDVGQKHRDACSRHRAAYLAPPTPEHFWELDFPDTQVCKERGYMNITQKVKMQARRRRPLKQLDDQ